MIELKCGAVSSFEFEMQISGDLTGTPRVCFTVDGPQFSLNVKAQQKGTGIWCVNLPALDKYFPCGDYPCELTVYLEDRYFVPMRDVVSLKDTPKPVVSNFSFHSTTAKPEVTIRPVAPTVAAVMTQPELAPAPPVADPAEVDIEIQAESVEATDPVTADLFSQLLRKKQKSN